MYASKQMIVMRRDLKMRKGKIAAQAGHACVDAVLRALAREGRLGQVRAGETGAFLEPGDMPATPLSEWFEKGEAKICVYVDSEEELLALAEAVQRAYEESGELPNDPGPRLVRRDEIPLPTGHHPARGNLPISRPRRHLRAVQEND